LLSVPGDCSARHVEPVPPDWLEGGERHGQLSDAVTSHIENIGQTSDFHAEAL
jgi:hypothetical protein